MSTSAEGKNKPNSFVEALVRLNKALDSLDTAVDAKLEMQSNVRSSDEQVQIMADDRARLARDLDGAEARAARLADTNKEVSRRLVGAMEIVRGVLDKSA